MDQRMIEERGVYLETKEGLAKLRRKVKKLKKRNKKERKT
jgi:hypothetical protein